MPLPQILGQSQVKTNPVNIAGIYQNDYDNRITSHAIEAQRKSARNKDLAALAQTLMKDPRFKKMMGSIGDMFGGDVNPYQPDPNDYMLGGEQYGPTQSADIPVGYDL